MPAEIPFWIDVNFHTYQARNLRLQNITSSADFEALVDGELGYYSANDDKRIGFYDLQLTAMVKVPRLDRAEIVTNNWRITRASESDLALTTRVGAETVDSFRLYAGGKAMWGDGVAAPDLTLERTGAGNLSFTGNLDVSGLVGLGAAALSGVRLRVSSVADGNNALLVHGTTKAARIVAGSGGTAIEGVDNTGNASYQPLTLGGSVLGFTISGVQKIWIDESANVGIGASSFGTSAAKVLGIASGTAPTTSPADMAQMVVADLNGAGTAGFQMRDETGSKFSIGRSSTLNYDSADESGPVFQLSKRGGTGNGATGNVKSGASLGFIGFCGNPDPTVSFASLFATAGGDWSAGVHPANLFLEVSDTAAGVLRFSMNSAGAMYFRQGSSDLLVMDANQNVVVSAAALATNATNGFLYVPSCAGTPTGTPTAYTGRIPLVFDSTNDKLYAYRGGWKSVTLV